MAPQLRTAIKLSETANAIFQRANYFDDEGIREPKHWKQFAHIGVEPMLLALSMELALKAWHTLDHGKSRPSHNLLNLFEGLKPESQAVLDASFRRTVAPYHPNLLYMDYGIKTVLAQHADAFVAWRYIHEPKNIQFQKSVFVATLRMVLEEFKNRYRTTNMSKNL